MASHKHDLSSKTVSKWRPLKVASFEANFFSQIVGTSEGETSVSGNAEC